MTIQTIIETDSFDEQEHFVREHFSKSGGNTWHIEALLRDPDIELTIKTREFIASILDGTAKKVLGKNKKRNKYYRDFNIYCAISDLLDDGIPLTSSRDKGGAAYQVSKIYRITEESALKIYQRMMPKDNLEDYI